MKTKKIYVILMAWLFLAYYSPGKIKNDLIQYNLKGGVKSKKLTGFMGSVKLGSFQIQGIKSISVTLFNEKGNCTEEYNYKSDSVLNFMRINKFDAHGIKIEENSYNSGGSLIYECTCWYDAQGNRIGENNYNSDSNLSYKLINKFDDNKNLIESDQYKLDGSLFRKSLYNYDSNGKLIDKNEYNNGGANIKTIYKYDAEGNENEINYFIIESENILNKFGDHITCKYDYDKVGNWIRKITFANDLQSGYDECELEYF